MEKNEREELQPAAVAQLDELRRRIERRDRIIGELNVALDRDLDVLFEDDQAA
jgi:hypothetical protein